MYSGANPDAYAEGQRQEAIVNARRDDALARVFGGSVPKTKPVATPAKSKLSNRMEVFAHITQQLQKLGLHDMRYEDDLPDQRAHLSGDEWHVHLATFCADRKSTSGYKVVVRDYFRPTSGVRLRIFEVADTVMKGLNKLYDVHGKWEEVDDIVARGIMTIEKHMHPMLVVTINKPRNSPQIHYPVKMTPTLTEISVLADDITKWVESYPLQLNEIVANRHPCMIIGDYFFRGFEGPATVSGLGICVKYLPASHDWDLEIRWSPSHAVLTAAGHVSSYKGHHRSQWPSAQTLIQAIKRVLDAIVVDPTSQP